MTSSEEFKQAIRTGNINEAFLVAMSNAPELSITTKIITSEGEYIPDNGNNGEGDNYLSTHINLIEGKVENEIGEKLTGDRYSEIKQFHMHQVAEGHQTIQHNLISLQKMFQLMSTFQQQGEEHQSWVDIAADVSRESLPPQTQASQLSGKAPEALAPRKIAPRSQTHSAGEEEQVEPRLPSFDEDEESVVEDLLSLADIDDDAAEESEVPEAQQEDWGEWLEEEPETEKRSEVFNLKSLNIKEAQNWQDWNSPPGQE